MRSFYKSMQATSRYVGEEPSMGIKPLDSVLAAGCGQPALSLLYGYVCPARCLVSCLYPSLSLFLHRILCLCCCSRLRDICRPLNRLLRRGSGGDCDSGACSSLVLRLCSD